MDSDKSTSSYSMYCVSCFWHVQYSYANQMQNHPCTHHQTAHRSLLLVWSEHLYNIYSSPAYNLMELHEVNTCCPTSTLHLPTCCWTAMLITLTKPVLIAVIVKDLLNPPMWCWTTVSTDARLWTCYSLVYMKWTLVLVEDYPLFTCLACLHHVGELCKELWQKISLYLL